MIFIKTLRKYRQRILFFVFVFVSASLLLGFSPGLSANYLTQQQVTIGANQVINDDLYLTGETLTIDGTVKGDAVLADKQITINGTIDGDLIATGQTVAINGAVNDDVRVAGQVLTFATNATNRTVCFSLSWLSGNTVQLRVSSLPLLPACPNE